MSYFGGKAGAGVYQRLINQIPPHDCYCEPFLGDGAVLRHLRPARRMVGIDRDPATLERWAGAALPGLELYRCDGIEWLRHEFGCYRITVSGDRASRDPASHDRKFLVCAATAADSECSDSRSTAAALCGCGRIQPHNQASGPSGPLWFVYCDPPYPWSTRGLTRYRYEMSPDDHQRLLDTIVRLPALVMISSYVTDQYAVALKDWRSFTFMATTRSGQRREETVWCNYPEPVALHDYRYLGKNKRQRERIRRRQRNYSAALDRMEPLERQAMMAHLAANSAPLRSTSCPMRPFRALQS